jgi:oligoribonuclease NrnB/cAMP/cGMP phosphodiesterase (DHH superfamily)
MNKAARYLVVLDHHKTAKENLINLPFAHFDMNKSGAILAWEHFFDDEPPIFLDYIQDRDLWKFELDNSREVNAALFSYPMEFEVWDEFENIRKFQDLHDEGIAILRARQRMIDSLTGGWAIATATIGGYEVPCLNCPRPLASETLNFLAEGQPFAAGYFDSADKRLFELRSAPDGVDVSEVAKQFGGGGHKHAAGFSVEKPAVW